jgi:adhesin transport system outer membrane protein
MSKNRFIKILLPSIMLTFGSQAFAYTLHEAVSHTLANSPDLLSVTNNRDKVDKELRESYSGYLPTLDMSAGWGEQWANNSNTRILDPIAGGSSGSKTLARTEFSLLASQMLFDGFAVYHDVEGHKARVRAQSWRVNGQAQDLALKAANAYLDVQLQRELVQVNKDNFNAHHRLFGQIHKRSEGGIGRKADLDQAEARVALSETNLIRTEGNLHDSETAFLRQVGTPTPSHLVRVTAPHPFPSSETEAVEMALRYNPIFRASVEDVVVTREKHKGAKSNFVPRFDLQLEISRNHNIDGAIGRSDDAYAMVRMHWNLFNGGKDLAKICETAFEMQEAQEIQNRARREVIDTVRRAWVRYTVAKRQSRALGNHVSASTRTMGAYEKQFNIGQRTLLDLLDAENELYTAKLEMIKAKYTQVNAMFEVLSTMGALAEYFNVPLPEQATPRPTGVMDGSMRFFNRSTPFFD